MPKTLGVILDADAILKWELALILASCFILMLFYAALGLRFNKLRTSFSQKILLMAYCFAVSKILFCFTFFKWIEDGVFLGRVTMDLVINMLISPLIPLGVIWLYLAHTVKSCNACEMAVPAKNIRTLPTPTSVLAYILAGVLTTVLLGILGLLCPRNINTIIITLTATALTGCAIELAYFRARENIIKLSLSTWCWFAGTWLGSVILYLL